MWLVDMVLGKLPISNNVAENRSGIGMMGMVDDGCNCIVMIDGGYEIMDLESKWSDDSSMSAICSDNE